jgi:selenobiotic family peptide radical SAM maturase
MNTHNALQEIYPACMAAAGPHSWEQIVSLCGKDIAADQFPSELGLRLAESGAPEFLADLARIEWARHSLQKTDVPPAEADVLNINPSLMLVEVSWKNLHPIAMHTGTKTTPSRGIEHILLWKNPGSDTIASSPANSADLLALKIVAEGLDVSTLALQQDVKPAQLEAILWQAQDKGILLPLCSRLRRPADFFPPDSTLPVSASVFTLQWHITQQCDLHCKHCYDRSRRSPLELSQALAILDDLRTFCRERNVRGQVSFTGGNPFLYPHFNRLYQEATDRGFGIAVLGNPVRRETLAEICAIQKPLFFQVSLEGLAEHNDEIRGSGHFERVLAFLSLLREFKIYSMVMLTLTEANMGQVLPLAKQLEGRVDLFTFNRLSLVGEGATLHPAPITSYPDFLREFCDATKKLRCLGLKDNFINVVRSEQGLPLFGGCTGFGCGAAFNFLAVLPDGEVHACRKFSSFLGNIFSSPLAAIYDSEDAVRYRRGPSACADCNIKAVCRGCLAVIDSFGLDISRDRDPYCFLSL